MGQGRRKRSPRWHKVAALLPLVALSGAAWSTNAAHEPATEPVADTAPLGSPAVPEDIFSQPASVALPEGFSAPTGLVPLGESAGSGAASYATSANGIPAAALSAYKRAAAILNDADPACNIDWTLIAAIGRVESDHGRFGGNALDGSGSADPGIFGLPLDGSGGTAMIRDSDDGALDNDPVYDRAVGPMQFIPGTWAVAGVDADQDGVKDPQDIDDAATATAVYLCAGDDDLSTVAGRRTAVYRYNHSNAYVDTVLAIMRAYASGDYSPVPNGTAAATLLTPADPARQASKAQAQQQTQQQSQRHTEQRRGPAQDGPEQSPSPSGDRSGDSTRSGGDNNSDRQRQRDGDKSEPSPSPTPTSAPDPVKTVEKSTQKVVETLGLAEATQLCRDKLAGDKGATQEIIDACGRELVGKTAAEANGLLTGSLVDILGRLGLKSLLGCLPLVGC